MKIFNYLKKNRTNTVLSIGIASMQADMASRTSMDRAIEACVSLYPANRIRSMFISKNRIRIGCFIAIVGIIYGHERWQNEPITQPMAITQAPANSPVRFWLMADSQIKVSRSIASWWRDTLSNQIPFKVESQDAQFGKNSSSTQSNVETNYDHYLKNATAFVAANYSFYSGINEALKKQWIPLQYGMVITLPHNSTPWMINSELGLDTIEHCDQFDVPVGSQIENHLWWDNHPASYITQLTPQDVFNGVLPVVADALHIRTWQAQANGHPDQAADDALIEIKLGVNALYMNASGNHSHAEAVLIILSGMADLNKLIANVNQKQALKIVNSLGELAAAIPDYKQLINEDILFNRGRLEYYLSRNAITLKTVAEAVQEELALESGNQQSPNMLKYIANLSLQWLTLSKSNVLQDYDHMRSQDYDMVMEASGFNNGYSIYPVSSRNDSIEWSAFSPSTDMILRPMIERILTKLGMAKIEYALQAYSAAHGRLPSQLSQLIPHYLSKIPSNLEVPTQMHASKYIVHKSIVYQREGNSYILYTLASQLRHVNTGSMNNRNEIYSGTNPDGTPRSATLHYRGNSARPGVNR